MLESATRSHRLRDWLLGALAALVLFVGGAAFGGYDPEGWQTGLFHALTTNGSSVDSTNDTGMHLQGSDGATWRNVVVTSAGALIVNTAGSSSATGGSDQMALSTTSAAVPTSALTNRTMVCVFNQDTAINVWCKRGAVAATLLNSNLIEPRTGRCYVTTQALQCRSTSGTPTIDYEEAGP